MILRTFSLVEVRKVMAPYLHELVGFDPKDLTLDSRNIILSDGEESLSFFEFVREGVYTGHWFFAKRGRQAVELANDMLDYLFLNHGVEVIQGWTPVEKKGAAWLARRVGFTSYGIVDNPVTPFELFILTRKDRERN